MIAEVVGVAAMPESIRSLVTLPDAAYGDLYGIETSATATPEQWARAIADHAAGFGGQVVWRGLLGLRLGPRRSPEHIAGWPVDGRGQDWIRVTARSPLLEAQLVVLVKHGRVSVGTFVQERHAAVRPLWSAVARYHRDAVPGLLRAAEAQLQGRRGYRLEEAEHRARRWLIDEIAPEFTLLDVWALPVEGASDEFGDVLEMLANLDPADVGSPLSRALFRVRAALGAVFGWDDDKPRAIPGAPDTTLRARVPDALRDTEQPLLRGFTPLYRADDEAAAELANDTVHGIVHVSWVPHGEGRSRARLAVYVKPRGTLGAVYMRVIDPFRHVVVYPALMRGIGRAWRRRREP